MVKFFFFADLFTCEVNGKPVFEVYQDSLDNREEIMKMIASLSEMVNDEPIGAAAIEFEEA